VGKAARARGGEEGRATAARSRGKGRRAHVNPYTEERMTGSGRAGAQKVFWAGLGMARAIPGHNRPSAPGPNPWRSILTSETSVALLYFACLLLTFHLHTCTTFLGHSFKKYEGNGCVE
jgi:hypothetical protein